MYFRKKIPHIAVLLSSLLLLSACRMPVVVTGEGFVFGAIDQRIYEDGHVFVIERDFEEKFWPVPAPGNYLGGWNRICSGPTKVLCHLKLNQDLWEKDEEIPLDVSFHAGYDGPLALIHWELYLTGFGRTLSVPVDSLVIEGIDAKDTPRLFLATTGMEEILPGRIRGDYYEFSLPVNSRYQPRDFWLFVSARDEEGTVASVGDDFGLLDDTSVGSLAPYENSSSYAASLVRCASASDPFNLCNMEELPYLGSVTPNPSVTEIMQRTVVSHPWMGKRFREVLTQMPPELRQMFGGITSVVISRDIRPAFFSPATGAIYLDPQYLWLTPAERASIDWTPDYRSEFGMALKFLPITDYLDGNKYAWRYSFEYQEGATRGINDIEKPFAWLLAHELAHANDAVPPAKLPAPGGPDTPLNLFFDLEYHSASSMLYNTYPLNSLLLLRVGAVLFHGEKPDYYIQSLTATEVAQEFEQDSANTMYAYSAVYEDTASLVEEVLMNYFYGVEKMEAFIKASNMEEPSCEELVLQGGSTNRTAVPRVRERARMVLSSILDKSDVSQYLSSVPRPTQLKRGTSLCDFTPTEISQLSNIPGIFKRAPRPVIREMERSGHHINHQRKVRRLRPDARGAR